jgi:hypothetical protein
MPCVGDARTLSTRKIRVMPSMPKRCARYCPSRGPSLITRRCFFLTSNRGDPHSALLANLKPGVARGKAPAAARQIDAKPEHPGDLGGV